MPLRPLNDRVLIRPAVSPDVTESGLILPENRSDKLVEMQGTVVAIGYCAHPLKHEAEVLAGKLEERVGDLHDYDHGDATVADAAKLLRDLVRREPSVKVGDDVLFSWSVGQHVTIDDEVFLMMRESDLLAVIESEPV